MNRAQFRIAAIGCWVAALAIVLSARSISMMVYWAAWIGAFQYDLRSSYDASYRGWLPGGLWAILLAALGGIAWVARPKPPPK